MSALYDEEKAPEALVGAIQKVARETAIAVAGLQATIEGQLVATLRSGSCWIEPPRQLGTIHRILRNTHDRRSASAALDEA